jgi:colanic acid biosynthesis glycosyl transferase WcaI
MRILIVNIYFHPDPTGTGLVITELARDLAAYGHQVTVITSVPHYGRFQATGDRRQRTRSASFRLSAVACRLRQRRLWTEALWDGIRVIRTAVYIPRRLTFLTRAINYASFSLLAMVAGLRCGPQDLILCTSPPLSLGVSAWLLSRLKGVPFVFNVQDIYPDAAILMGMVRSAWLVAQLQRLERFVYRCAALVTVISGGARSNLLAKGVPDGKLAVIPNWVNEEHIRPVPADNEFRRSLGMDGARIVMFAGNIGLIAGLESVLEAAAALRHRPDIQFMIVGEGNAKAGLVARARTMALQNVTFLPTQPREILPQVLGSADVHLVTLKRRMSTTSVPSKTYGIMASGRPAIAAVDPGSEVWRLVEAADAGVCVAPEEPGELARAIEALCDDPDRRQRLGENARAYVTRHNTKSALTRLYEQTLRRVAGGAAHLEEGSHHPAAETRPSAVVSVTSPEETAATPGMASRLKPSAAFDEAGTK